MEKVGDYLRKERIKRGISLENIASITKICVDILGKIEANDFDNLPATTYVKGFIRSFSDVIGVDKDEVIGLYKKQIGEVPLGESLKVKKDGKIKKSKDLSTGITADLNQTSKIFVQEVDGDIPDEESSRINKIQLPVNLAEIKKKNIVFVSGGILCSVFILFLLFYRGDDYPENKSIEPLASEEFIEENNFPVEIVVDTVASNATQKENIVKVEPNKEIKKEPMENKNPIDFSKGYSVLKVASKGKSWIKYKIDNEEVTSITFIVGMARSFRVYRSIELFIGNVENVDIFFNDIKIDLVKQAPENMLVLKHIPGQKKEQETKQVVNSQNLVKEKFKIDEDLISPPQLRPEKLTF